MEIEKSPPLCGELMNKFFNRNSETDKRRQLRGSMPNAEVILW